MKILRSILFIQIFVLMVSQEVMGGIKPRQKRPLDLFNVQKTQEFNRLEDETSQLDKLLAARGLISPNERVASAASNERVASGDALKPETKSELELESRQGDDFLPFNSTLLPFNSTLNDTDGFICMNKVMTVSEIVYDEEVRCNHVSYRNCYQAYKTVYRPQATESCIDNFKKECFIEYEDVAKTEVVRICSAKAERNCDTVGPIVCTTVYQTVCETKFRSYNVSDQSANCSIISAPVCWNETINGKLATICRDVPKTECNINTNDLNKSFPETECRKEPNEVCGPEKCPVVTTEGCEDIEKTFVTPVPKERCELKPYKICNTEVISLPSLEQVNECVDVPKEVCSVEQVNPRQVERNVTKKWCAKDANFFETTTLLPDGEYTTVTPLQTSG
jgi:hypothetical protein